MNYKEMLRNTLSKDGFWQVNKKIAKLTDNDTAILLADLISKEMYFEDRCELTADGFFFNTVKNIEEDCNIKKDKQNRCIEKLMKLNLIDKQTVRIKDAGKFEHRRYFKINHDNIVETLSKANDCSSRKIRHSTSQITIYHVAKTASNKNKVIKINNKNKSIHSVDENTQQRVCYNSSFDAEEHIANFTDNRKVLELYSYFIGLYYRYTNIWHSVLTDEQIVKVVEVIKECLNECYIETEEDIMVYLEYYLAEKRKYYSAQEFFQVKNMQIWSSRYYGTGYVD